ncbi:MAG: acetyl-CoA carboxylase carboxyl transferase subunit beta, partial [Gammaproteobacteria bacterium]|nr:acetyl-CoA carboxylase carboxyl transferase subunit beta [Gammaproteobacteria bacterium]
MSWFDKLMPSRIKTEGGSKKAVPEGLWAKCPGCGAILYKAELDRSFNVFPKCSLQNRFDSSRRIELFLDPDNQQEIAEDLQSLDPLKFK